MTASSLLAQWGGTLNSGTGTRLPVRSLFGARRRSALSTVRASRRNHRASQNSRRTSERQASRAMAQWHLGCVDGRVTTDGKRVHQ